MNNMPSVFVPTQPDSDGITLPTLLSILAHGVIFGFLIYTYHYAEIETVGTIETVMVSPEQLADMQGQILANQAAAASASQSSASSLSTESAQAFDATDSRPSEPNTVQQTSQSVPVFTRSDDLPSQPILMSEELHLRRLEQMQEYRRNMALSAAELDEAMAEERNNIEQERKNQLIEEQNRLKELRQKQNNPPKINKPTSTQRNIDIESGSSSPGKTYSLSDGRSTISDDGATSSPATGSSRSASSGSRGSSNSQIISLIKRNYNPPIAAKGSTQRATLTITVSANGSVVNVSATGPDSAVNEAAKQAVLDTRTLPIDSNDPKYPTFTIEFKGSN